MDKEIMWVYYNPKDALQEAYEKDDEEEETYESKTQKPPKFLENPFIPTEYWVGHTNFKLCQSHFNILNHQVLGVEAFKFLSNYRMVIVPAQMFTWSDVRKDIEQKLCNKHISYTNNLEFNRKIQNEKTKLIEYPFWAMHIFPNGEIHTIKSLELTSDFEKALNEIYQTQKLTSGLIIESEQCQKMKK